MSNGPPAGPSRCAPTCTKYSPADTFTGRLLDVVCPGASSWHASGVLDPDRYTATTGSMLVEEASTVTSPSSVTLNRNQTVASYGCPPQSSGSDSVVA